MGVSDYMLLQKYWMQEPWGAYRDNLHAGIIAREVRRGNFRGAHSIEPFMIVHKDLRKVPAEQRAANNGLISMLKTIAKRVPIEASTKVH